MHFYIKFSNTHVPISFEKRDAPLGPHNTKAGSLSNGKPYSMEATREGYEPFDPNTQTRSGPVLEASPPVIRYTVVNKSAQDIDDEKDTNAVAGLNTPQNKTIFAALWEMHEAITGAQALPAETKAAYKARLKDVWKGLL